MRNAILVALALALLYRIDVRLCLINALIESLPDPEGEPPPVEDVVTVWLNGHGDCPL